MADTGERESLCPNTINFEIKPTDAAIGALLWDDKQTLVETISAFLDGEWCSDFDVVLSSHCDEITLGTKIAATQPKPDVEFTQAREQWLIVEGVEQYNSTQNGEVFKTGEYPRVGPYKIWIDVGVKLSLAMRWVPPDCCCVYVVNATISLTLTVLYWPVHGERPGERPSDEWTRYLDRFTEAVCQPFVEFYRSPAFRDSVRRRIAAIPPKCEKLKEPDCEKLRITHAKELSVDLEQSFASSILYDAPSVERCKPFTMYDDTIVINTRDYLDYGGYPYNARINNGFDFKNYIDSQLPEPTSCPCCFLIWVHGYNNSYEEAVRGLSQIRYSYLKAGGCCQLIGFVWNSDPFALAFSHIEEGANLVALGPFAYLVRELKRRCPNARINLASHSLGARIILKALHHADITGVDDIDTVVLASAAVANESLEPGRDFGKAPSHAKSIHVAYNKGDLVLFELFQASYFGIGGAALGYSGTEHSELKPENVHNYDFTEEWWATSGRILPSHSSVYFDVYNRRESIGDFIEERNHWYPVNRTFWKRYVGFFAGERACRR